jgi:hypothetical protein
MMQLRRRDFAGAARTLGLRKKKPSRAGLDLTQKWLELQYGWKPLLSDVYGATEALANRDRGDWRVTGKGTQFVKVEGSIDESSDPNGWDSGYGEYHGRRGVYVRIDALPQNDLLLAMSQLGLTNPLLIAWELVPYSFVVDWFLPIGSYLDSLDAMLGYGPASCSITQWQKIEVGLKRIGKWESSTQKLDVDWRGFHYENIFLKRTTSSSVPLPTLPRFKDPRSLGHMANGLALLAGAFASGGKSPVR